MPHTIPCGLGTVAESYGWAIPKSPTYKNVIKCVVMGLSEILAIMMGMPGHTVSSGVAKKMLAGFRSW